MDDRNHEILNQYNIKIFDTYRGRGAIICNTDKGLMKLKEFTGSKYRIEFEFEVKNHLIQKGYTNVDQYIKNEKGEILTQDRYGNKFVLKNWFEARECDLNNKEEVVRAAANLATLHKIMRGVPIEDEKIKYNSFSSLEDSLEKHTKELRKVKGYINNKKKKNEFEVRFLSCFNEFFTRGQEALDMLNRSIYTDLYKKALKERAVCHGSYNYHNILMLNNGKIATTNFDKLNINVQIMDLYQYIRKVMEKNSWSVELGNDIIDAYNKIIQISRPEKECLYIMLLYPEKFWKITNHYYNSRKSFLPKRNTEKLSSLQAQSIGKDSFLDNFKKDI